MTREKALHLRALLVKASASLSDEDALEAVELFAVWAADTEYTVDQRVRHGDKLYRCVQGHTSQEGWEPDKTPALWVLVDNPAEEWPEWHQPQGAHDAYAAGKKVSHNGRHWINTYGDGNIWEPGVYGWEEVS